MSEHKGEDFVTVKLKAGVGSLTIHDGRLAIKLAGAGPHRVTRAEWEHSRELRQYAEEQVSGVRGQVSGQDPKPDTPVRQAQGPEPVEGRHLTPGEKE